MPLPKRQAPGKKRQVSKCSSRTCDTFHVLNLPVREHCLFALSFEQVVRDKGDKETI